MFFRVGVRSISLCVLLCAGVWFFQDLFVNVQEVPRSQTPSGVPCLGPGIGKIEKQPVHFVFIEEIRHASRIRPDQAEV